MGKRQNQIQNSEGLSEKDQKRLTYINQEIGRIRSKLAELIVISSGFENKNEDLTNALKKAWHQNWFEVAKILNKMYGLND